MKEIIYHSNCCDGIIGREILHQCLCPEAAFVPYNYESDFGHLDGAIWVDCSPKKLDDFIWGLENGCVYLDHHETQQEFFDYIFQERPDLAHLISFGNKEQSGAWLAYAYVGYPEAYREVARLAKIADCFISDQPDFALARAMSKFVSSIGNKFTYSVISFEYFLALVKAFQEKNEARAKMLAKSAYIFPKASLPEAQLKVAFINNSEISDASEILRNEYGCDIIVGYTMSNNGIYISMRSNDNFNCSEFCKKLGGGGHKNAAGIGGYKYNAVCNFDTHFIDMIWKHTRGEL